MAECRRFETKSFSEFMVVPCDVTGRAWRIDTRLPGARKKEGSESAMEPTWVNIIWKLRAYESRVSFNRPQR